LEGRRSVLWLQLAWAYRARSHWLAGQHDEADRWFTRAVMPTAAGEDGGVITTEAWRAVHLAATARFDPAAALAREIAERAEPSDIEVQTFWRAALAVALSARGDHREARWFADEALEISAPVDMFWIRGEALAAAGQVLVADGRADEGRALLREALDLYEHAGAAGAVSELRARCGLEDL
jgi:tetratricopeptide (TPR) repeat protein